MNLFIRPRSLTGKLVARDIDNLKPFFMIVMIDLFEILILRSKTASGCSIHNQKYFAFIVFEGYGAAICSRNSVVIDIHNLLSSFILSTKVLYTK